MERYPKDRANCSICSFSCFVVANANVKYLLVLMFCCEELIQQYSKGFERESQGKQTGGMSALTGSNGERKEQGNEQTRRYFLANIIQDIIVFVNSIVLCYAWFKVRCGRSSVRIGSGFC